MQMDTSIFFNTMIMEKVTSWEKKNLIQIQLLKNSVSFKQEMDFLPNCRVVNKTVCKEIRAHLLKLMGKYSVKKIYETPRMLYYI